MSENRAISVHDLIAFSLDQFSSVAWQKLGLHPDPITGKVEMNLLEAKLAIDVAGMLAQKIEPLLDEADRRRVQRMIADLKLNFVQKSEGQ